MQTEGTQILALGEQLAHEGQVPLGFVDQLEEELKTPEQLQALQKLLSERSMKQLLRLHMLSAYSAEASDQVLEGQASELTYAELKLAWDRPSNTPATAFSKGNAMASLIASSLEALETKFQTSNRFLSLMLCSRKEKIIQNYFGRLVELLLGTGDYAYARWNTDDPHPKIQYFSSSLSFLTVFLRDEPNFRTLRDCFAKLGRGIHELRNCDPKLKQVFNVAEAADYLCQVADRNGECLIFVFRSIDQEVCKQVTADHQLANLYELLLSEAAETLHASKFEVLNTQYALKSILNLLEFCIKVDARLLQRTLEDHYKSTVPAKDLEDLLRKLAQDSTENKQVAAVYEGYCTVIFWLEATINKYKAQTMDTSSVYLNFNRNGELGFVSNRLPSFLGKNLVHKEAELEEVTVFDLFAGKAELMSRLRQAAEGKPTDEVCRFVQDARIAEAVFEFNDKFQLSGFYVKVGIKKRQEVPRRSDTSFKNLSSNSIHSTDSESDLTAKLRAGTGINREAQRMLVEQEQLRPGVSKTGWLEAFMKNDVLDKYRRNAFPSKKDIGSEVVKPNPRKRMSVSLSYEPSSEAAKTLMLMDSFDMNLLQVDKEHLLPLARAMLLRLKFCNSFKVDDEVLDNFLRELAAKYGKHGNPFHNFTHGVNGTSGSIAVMHMCYLLGRLEKYSEYLSDVNLFALVFSGLCHDVGHPGRTNQFEINSQSKKAVRYNDRSPLENYHASTSYQILLKPENNFLSVLKKEQFTQIRKEFVANILATDIKEHFVIVNNVEAKIKSPKGFEKIPADVELTTSFLIHTSDFAGACMPFSISRKWAELVNLEFTSQYNQEGELGLPQTPYMKNLDQEDVMAQNEAGFLKVIVRPLFKLLNDQHEKEEEVRRLLKNLDDNMLIWEKIVADSKARAEPKN